MKTKKIIFILLVSIAIYIAFRFFLPIVFPFVIAGVVSTLYYPFLRRLYRDSGIWNGGKKKWLLMVSVVCLYVVILLLILWLGGYLFGQGHSIWLNFPFYQARAVCLIKSCCCQIDVLLRMENGACFAYIEGVIGKVDADTISALLPKVTTYSVHMAGQIFNIVFEIIITVISTFFMIQDYEQIREKMLESEWGRNVCRIIATGKETLKIYMRAQGFILLLDGIVCTLAFLLIKQPYAWVLGPLTALVDALPVLGAGLILWPYIMILLVAGHIKKAGIVLLAYLCCLLIRQITEPRMIGGKVGMRPLYTIFSMYVGFRLFGVLGFLLGPVGVLIGKELYRTYFSP
ncbi:MAG: AI-2E family transporter [Clostridium sp.]|nr:AI-2E family transporter [Clostridium sp.]